MRSRLLLGLAAVLVLAGQAVLFYQLGMREGRRAVDLRLKEGASAGAKNRPGPPSSDPAAKKFTSPAISDGSSHQRGGSEAPQVSSIEEALALEDLEARREAMIAMVRTLIAQDRTLDPQLRERLLARLDRAALNPYGLETALAAIVVQLSDGEKLAESWRRAFAQHPSRATIFAALVANLEVDAPHDRFAPGVGWTEWEKRTLNDAVINLLKSKDSQMAVERIRANPREFNQSTVIGAFLQFARRDTNEFDKVLESLEDPTLRRAAIQGKAQALASWDTNAANAWADSLPSEEEREVAHSEIFEATPRGIGAAIALRDGFVQFQSVLPASPLHAAGIREGDRITSVRDAAGNEVDLFATDLSTAINSLRGDPNSPIQLQVLRWDQELGSMSEFEVALSRRQMYMSDGEIIGDIEEPPG